MKRYFTMSLTLFLFSILNALTFLLLGILTGNTAYSEIYSITYPIQFVVAIFQSFFASASNIRANKEGNKNCVDTGIILGLIFSTITFTLLSVFVDNYITFMNMSPEIYRNFTLMSFGELFLSFILSMLTEKMYFKDQDKKANLCTIGFIVLNFATVVLTALITKNQLVIVLVNFVSLFVYVLVWFCLTIKKFKFDFNIIQNFKYESLYTLGNVLMLVTYLFGYSSVFSFGGEYVVALNFVNLITDPQWDALEAMDKIAKIDISNSEYNYKKALKNSAVISSTYCLSSIVLFFALFKTYKVVLTIGLIYLAIQIADMLLEVFLSNLQPFLQIEYSPTKSTIVSLVSKVLRALISILWVNPYNTNVGQIGIDILILVCFFIMRFRNFKLSKDGTLVRKEKPVPIKQ